MEQDIIMAAGFYLTSHSGYLLVLNTVEISDLGTPDYDRMLKEVNAAIAHMEKANQTYRLLKKKADNTAYDPKVINQLIAFDYTAFCSHRGLNAEIFNRSVCYLSTGDVRGLYAKIVEDTQDMLDYLKLIKESIAAHKLPDNWDIWRLNQQYGETLLMGQYVAEVFLSLP